MIRLQCVCGRRIAAPDQWLGKRVKCPQCGKPVLVAPAEGAPAQAARSEEAAPRAEPVVARAESVERSASAAESSARSSADATATVAPEVTAAAPDSVPPPPPSTIEEPQEEFRAPIEPSPSIAAPVAEPIPPRKRESAPVFKPAPAPSAPVPVSSAEPPPANGDDEDDFYMKQRRLPRFLGTLGLLVAIGAGASCWVPQLDGWTLYIALGGVALSTIGFGFSMSRYRLGLGMPVLGLIASLAVMGLPYVLPYFGKIAPARYVERAVEEREQKAEAEDEAQRRGLLSVESLRLTGNKDSLAPEVAYKLINRSGKTIKQIIGSIQLTDRDHRPLGGLALNLSGSFAPNAVIDGKNEWTMEDATQSAIADNHFTAEYRADQVVYSDGTTKSYAKP